MPSGGWLQVGPVRIPQKIDGRRINWHAVGVLSYFFFKNFNAVLRQKEALRMAANEGVTISKEETE
jgi:glucose-6-phosphate isomerase